MKQANRAGRPWQRKDGRWAARAYPPDGSAPRMVYAATEAEVLERQHAMEAGAIPSTGKLPASAAPPKPARVTLNLPPQLYRDLQRWCDTTAEVLDVPRVGVQEALRGFIREITANPAVSAKMIASVKDELGNR